MEFEDEVDGKEIEGELCLSATDHSNVEKDAYDEPLLSVRNEVFDKLQVERDPTPPSHLVQIACEPKKSKGRDSALATLEQENKRQLMKFEILQRFADGESQSSLAREFGLSKKQVFNIVHGKSRLDGSTKAGRRTGLSPSTEVLLAHEIAWLANEKMITLTGEDFSKYCQVLWRAEGHEGEPPIFGEKYRRGFSKRHKNLALKSFRVSAKRNIRHRAGTVTNVAYFLNSLKMNLDKVKASHVFSVDELDVSANDKGLGEKHIGVAGIKPRHITDDRTPHISACPFIPLSGTKGYCAFVVQGVLEPAEVDPDYVLDHGDILETAKGVWTQPHGARLLTGLCGLLIRSSAAMVTVASIFCTYSLMGTLSTRMW